MIMANGYTIVPSIIPGPLTVNGILTVNNNCGIRIGGASPFLRLFTFAGGFGFMSMNLGCDLATRDNPAVAAQAYELLTNGNNPGTLQENPAGTQIVTGGDNTIAQDGALVSNTGNTTENTLKSKLIPGNILGPHGYFILETSFIQVVQGGVNSTFRVRLGASAIATINVGAVGNLVWRLHFLNSAANAAQKVWSVMFSPTTVVANTLLSTTVDTSVDQTLSLTLQNGAATDNYTCSGWKVHGVVGASSAV